MPRPFRFGVTLLTLDSGPAWREKCRRAEETGYDVLLVPDHLGRPSPFPALVAAAEATERPRVGTFVLNAGFWNPALLAREVATADALTGGRLELGLGTGYVKGEHDAAGLPFEAPGRRVDHLEHTIRELDRLLGDPGQLPKAVQRPRPPLMIGGNGPRMLRLAARHADIAAFTGARQAPGRPEGTLELLPAEQVAASVAAYAAHEAHAADRAEPAERNILVQQVLVTDDRRAAARELAAQGVGVDEDQALEVPTLLIGTPAQMAEQLRERHGFSYVTVLDRCLEAFAPVVGELKGS